MGQQNYSKGLYIGLDVGSTTVKAVVMDPETDEILWSDYQRHETKQPENSAHSASHNFERTTETELPLATGTR